MAQAIDRAHRIGQKNVVTVIMLVCKDTIEERVLSVLEAKKKITSEVLQDGVDEYQAIGMSPFDIAKLL